MVLKYKSILFTTFEYRTSMMIGYLNLLQPKTHKNIALKDIYVFVNELNFPTLSLSQFLFHISDMLLVGQNIDKCLRQN